MKKHDLTNTNLHRKSPGKVLYAAFVGVTMAAIVTASVALLLMNFSRSGCTVDESRAWLKLIITWAILNGLGFIMSYHAERPFHQFRPLHRAARRGEWKDTGG